MLTRQEQDVARLAEQMLAGIDEQREAEELPTRVGDKKATPVRITPELEGGIMATDPEVGIEWPWPATDLTLSAKDQVLSPLSDLVSPFQYDSGSD